ncbi:hypothetical protein PSN45_003581 [Yamadazyma tenuis]|uniref:TPR-like protein n=1 Tax=Candida tenuis (strain ATCC 10573 / BCRC 21748 / CBS 615 / JCM 9827 / NBRC 10315 / NRRL Y-1498 / VKM Y-70) TaxID=590646 RepID=G3AXL5_CANTC|nr:uncharacterized protein CANTEDRAFT_112519 [Yamadazyma tenuis ATCC 10573]XP_006684689.1 uncharacterized protein CANTEDRAFT_112519 [Yamadazyma tenuis ATCC 10573]EGV66114.1 hypothetical protein CANTEDRAFT_112519 [Yamadazyma tenuis ATCC 10573]EGV66115.1 hypothetical protein CANTEDRAFT_112519 [Yamadazyma tenuis ATCC 10573]WEJ96047.1 hypothetical protein PSN45_003581 [Yamadazyma tenuis]
MGIIEEARHFLDNSLPEEALELLTSKLVENQADIEYLQLYGEVLLENNQVEDAYNLFIKTCEMDPIADKGVEKFLYLGQIIGGEDGIAYLDVGLNKLNEQFENGNKDIKTIKKLNEGIFAKIEIWMTDLCMEPEAESKCDELIDYALKVDDSYPETYSLLASIRISQQRNEDAEEALARSWELFQQRKQKIQLESINDEMNFEVIELIQPFITIIKFAIELELYDLAIEVCQATQDINDQILDIYYYEVLANLFKSKQQYPQRDKQTDYRDLPNSVVDEDTKSDVKLILTSAFKILQTSDDLDPELTESINSLLAEFGGPIMSELMPQRGDDNDDGWEDEIDDN